MNNKMLHLLAAASISVANFASASSFDQDKSVLNESGWGWNLLSDSALNQSCTSSSQCSDSTSDTALNLVSGLALCPLD